MSGQTTLGQKVSALSRPIVIASDQSLIPVGDALGSAIPSHAVGEGVSDGALLQMVRQATIFKSNNASPGNGTSMWAPATGKKFRLLFYYWEIPANAAISGGGQAVTLSMTDGVAGSSILQNHTAFIPTTAATTGPALFTVFVPLGQLGILSAAANNVLCAVVSVAPSTSSVRVGVGGTEE